VAAAALAIGQYVAIGKVPTSAKPTETLVPAAAEDVPVKGQRAADFIAAFNKGDAKAVAGFWTPDGDYTDQAGQTFKGRAALEKLYAQSFAESKGAKLTITVTSHKAVGTDVILEDGLTEVTPADGGPGTVGRFSALLVKKDGEWYFESVRETIARPPTNAAHFDGIDWLIGDWVGEAEKGESAVASYAWAENQNFIVSTFATTLNGVPMIGGTQWISYDAVDKTIRSSTFYSGGGVGEATWSLAGNVTSVTASVKTAAGNKVSVVNVMTKVDADHATFQATKLVVDGKPMPDGPVIKLKRAGTK
jgi:uncharacterized protein (TIGR02246 family)